MSEPLTIAEALEILGVGELRALTDDDFTRLKRRAMRRWHPDTIAGLRPSEAQVRHYTRNFQRIAPALTLLREHLDAQQRQARATAWESEAPPPPEPPEVVIRRHAAAMQAELRAVWEAVQRTGYRLHEEEYTAFAGVPVPEALRQERAEELPVLAVAAVLGVVALLAPLAYFPEARVPLLVGLAVYAAFLAPVSFPLARWWLPRPLRQVSFLLLDAGLAVYNRLVRLHYWCARTVLGLVSWPLEVVLIWPVQLLRPMLNVAFAPLYRMLGWLLRRRRLGVVRRKERYYAGFAVWYIEALLKAAPRALSTEELAHLARLHAALRDGPAGG